MISSETDNRTNSLLFVVTLVAAALGCVLICLILTLTSSETYLFSSVGTLCSSYLVIKYQGQENHLHILTIVSSVFIFLFTLVCLIRLFLKKVKDGPQCLKIDLKDSDHIFLYIFYSLALVWNGVVLGRFLDVLIDGKNCLGSTFSSWIYILVLSVLTFLLLAISWILNLNKINQIPEERVKEDDQISFGIRSPYFENIQRNRQICKPFLDSVGKIQNPEGHRKKTDVVRLKKEMNNNRQEVSFQKSYDKQEEGGQDEQQSEQRRVTMKGRRQNKIIKDNFINNTQKIGREKSKTICFDLPQQKQPQNKVEDSFCQSRRRQFIPSTITKQDLNLSIRKREYEIERSVSPRRFERDSFSDHEDAINFSSFKQNHKNIPTHTNQVSHQIPPRKKVVFCDRFSENSTRKLEKQSEDWMFEHENPYGKYLQEDEAKQEELQMFIFSKQSANLTKNEGQKYLIFEKKADPISKKKCLFNESLPEDPRPLSPSRKRESSLHKFEEEVLNTLKSNSKPV